MLVSMIAGAAVGLSGCGSSSSGNGAGNSSAALKQEIHIAANAAPDTFDLARTTAAVAKELALGSVFESLVAQDENFKPQPELAETIDVNPEHTEYTYHLRKGVLFHNGQEMKADDVTASMNRWIEGAGSVKKAAGQSRFVKIDDYTVKITFDHPLANFNEMIAGISPEAIIVPKSVIDNADPKTGMIKEYIGTGPYMIASFKSDTNLTLKKFDQYKPYGTKEEKGWWGYKDAKTPTIVYDFVTDDSTRVAGMQSGEYDAALQMPVDSYEQFKGNQDFQIHKDAFGELAMVYNKKKGIASNPLIRQAVNAALNDSDIMKAGYVEQDFYDLNSSYIVGKSNPWYSEAGHEFYNMNDPAKARQILQQAGYNGEPFRILVSSHYQEFYNAAIVVEKELKDLGINVQLNVVDWATYLTQAKDADAYDAFITSFQLRPMPGAVTFLSPTWNGWSDDSKVVSAIEGINRNPDAAAAKKDWDSIQEYMWSEYLPVSKLGDINYYDVSSAKTQGFDTSNGASHAWNMTVEQ